MIIEMEISKQGIKVEVRAMNYLIINWNQPYEPKQIKHSFHDLTSFLPNVSATYILYWNFKIEASANFPYDPRISSFQFIIKKGQFMNKKPENMVLLTLWQ